MLGCVNWNMVQGRNKWQEKGEKAFIVTPLLPRQMWLSIIRSHKFKSIYESLPEHTDWTVGLQKASASDLLNMQRHGGSWLPLQLWARRLISVICCESLLYFELLMKMKFDVLYILLRANDKSLAFCKSALCYFTCDFHLSSIQVIYGSVKITWNDWINVEKHTYTAVWFELWFCFSDCRLSLNDFRVKRTFPFHSLEGSIPW